MDTDVLYTKVFLHTYVFYLYGNDSIILKNNIAPVVEADNEIVQQLMAMGMSI
jgi:hypothetical protein